METSIGKQLARTPTSCPTIPKVSSNAVAKFIECKGWTRKIAGDEDFGKAVEAVTTAHNAGRGLFISGKPGVGKTSLLRALAKNYQDSVFLYCKNKEDIATMRDTRSFDLNVGSVFIDDLGCEEIVHEYGNVIDVVGDFIQFLHNRFNGRVFISSNIGLSKQWEKDANGNRVRPITPEGVNERYGGRVLDRILEMCVCFQMKGKSKRERIIL